MDRDPQPKPRSDSENDAVYTLSISPGDALQFEVFPDGWAELRLSNPKRSRVAAAFFDSQRGAYVVLRIWRVGWEEEEEMYPRPPGPKPSTRIVSFAFPGAEPTVTTTHDHVHVHLGRRPRLRPRPRPRPRLQPQPSPRRR